MFDSLSEKLQGIIKIVLKNYFKSNYKKNSCKKIKIKNKKIIE